MATTVEEVARAALGAADTAAGHVLASQWVVERYRNLVGRTRFRHLRKVGELTVPANLKVGTVTTTLASKIVTGDATASAAWTSAVVGRHFRSVTTWYEIEGFDDSNAAAKKLILRTPFADITAAAGSAYVIAARRIALTPEARWLGDFVNMYRRVRLEALSMAQFDLRAPDRPRTGMGPYAWAELWSAEEGNGKATRPKLVELYPYPDADTLIHYVYWGLPLTLDMDSVIPQETDPEILKEGVLIDIYRYNASKAANAGQVDVAAYWRNEYRAQMTTWENVVIGAIRADRGADDTTFILELPGSQRYAGREIMTAHDLVWNRWPF